MEYNIIEDKSMNQYTHKNGIVYKNQFHIIFSPKYRKPVLTGNVEKRLKEIFYDEADKMDVEIKALEIMPDHVHMFIEFDPRLMLHKVVKQFKGKSSHILREEFPFLKSSMPSLWTRSYFSCSVGHISEDTIKKYIESQQKRIR